MALLLHTIPQFPHVTANDATASPSDTTTPPSYTTTAAYDEVADCSDARTVSTESYVVTAAYQTAAIWGDSSTCAQTEAERTVTIEDCVQTEAERTVDTAECIQTTADRTVTTEDCVQTVAERTVNTAECTQTIAERTVEGLVSPCPEFGYIFPDQLTSTTPIDTPIVQSTAVVIKRCTEPYDLEICVHDMDPPIPARSIVRACRAWCHPDVSQRGTIMIPAVVRLEEQERRCLVEEDPCPEDQDGGLNCVEFANNELTECVKQDRTNTADCGTYSVSGQRCYRMKSVVVTEATEGEPPTCPNAPTAWPNPNIVTTTTTSVEPTQTQIDRRIAQAQEQNELTYQAELLLSEQNLELCTNNPITATSSDAEQSTACGHYIKAAGHMVWDATDPSSSFAVLFVTETTLKQIFYVLSENDVFGDLLDPDDSTSLAGRLPGGVLDSGIYPFAQPDPTTGIYPQLDCVGATVATHIECFAKFSFSPVQAQSIVISGIDVNIPQGVAVSAKLQIFGFNIAANIEISSERFKIQGTMDRVNLEMGGQSILIIAKSSSESELLGPEFMLDMDRAEDTFIAEFHGYLSVVPLGFSAEAHVNVDHDNYKVHASGSLFNYICAEVDITANRGASPYPISFLSKISTVGCSNEQPSLMNLLVAAAATLVENAFAQVQQIFDMIAYWRDQLENICTIFFSDSTLREICNDIRTDPDIGVPIISLFDLIFNWLQRKVVQAKKYILDELQMSQPNYCIDEETPTADSCVEAPASEPTSVVVPEPDDSTFRLIEAFISGELTETSKTVTGVLKFLLFGHEYTYDSTLDIEELTSMFDPIVHEVTVHFTAMLDSVTEIVGEASSYIEGKWNNLRNALNPEVLKRQGQEMILAIRGYMGVDERRALTLSVSGDGMHMWAFDIDGDIFYGKRGDYIEWIRIEGPDQGNLFGTAKINSISVDEHGENVWLVTNGGHTHHRAWNRIDSINTNDPHDANKWTWVHNAWWGSDDMRYAYVSGDASIVFTIEDSSALGEQALESAGLWDGGDIKSRSNGHVVNTADAENSNLWENNNWSGQQAIQVVSTYNGNKLWALARDGSIFEKMGPEAEYSWSIVYSGRNYDSLGNILLEVGTSDTAKSTKKTSTNVKIKSKVAEGTLRAQRKAERKRLRRLKRQLINERTLKKNELRRLKKVKRTQKKLKQIKENKLQATTLLLEERQQLLVAQKVESKSSVQTKVEQPELQASTSFLSIETIKDRKQIQLSSMLRGITIDRKEAHTFLEKEVQRVAKGSSLIQVREMHDGDGICDEDSECHSGECRNFEQTSSGTSVTGRCGGYAGYSACACLPWPGEEVCGCTPNVGAYNYACGVCTSTPADNDARLADNTRTLCSYHHECTYKHCNGGDSTFTTDDRYGLHQCSTGLPGSYCDDNSMCAPYADGTPGRCDTEGLVDSDSCLYQANTRTGGQACTEDGNECEFHCDVAFGNGNEWHGGTCTTGLPGSYCDDNSMCAPYADGTPGRCDTEGLVDSDSCLYQANTRTGGQACTEDGNECEFHCDVAFGNGNEWHGGTCTTGLPGSYCDDNSMCAPYADGTPGRCDTEGLSDSDSCLYKENSRFPGESCTEDGNECQYHCEVPWNDGNEFGAGTCTTGEPGAYCDDNSMCAPYANGNPGRCDTEGLFDSDSCLYEERSRDPGQSCTEDANECSGFHDHSGFCDIPTGGGNEFGAGVCRNGQPGAECEDDYHCQWFIAQVLNGEGDVKTPELGSTCDWSMSRCLYPKGSRHRHQQCSEDSECGSDDCDVDLTSFGWHAGRCTGGIKSISVCGDDSTLTLYGVDDVGEIFVKRGDAAFQPIDAPTYTSTGDNHWMSTVIADNTAHHTHTVNNLPNVHHTPSRQAPLLDHVIASNGNPASSRNNEELWGVSKIGDIWYKRIGWSTDEIWIPEAQVPSCICDAGDSKFGSHCMHLEEWGSTATLKGQSCFDESCYLGYDFNPSTTVESNSEPHGTCDLNMARMNSIHITNSDDEPQQTGMCIVTSHHYAGVPDVEPLMNCNPVSIHAHWEEGLPAFTDRTYSLKTLGAMISKDWDYMLKTPVNSHVHDTPRWSRHNSFRVKSVTYSIKVVLLRESNAVVAHDFADWVNCDYSVILNGRTGAETMGNCKTITIPIGDHVVIHGDSTKTLVFLKIM